MSGTLPKLSSEQKAAVVAMFSKICDSGGVYSSYGAHIEDNIIQQVESEFENVMLMDLEERGMLGTLRKKDQPATVTFDLDEFNGCFLSASDIVVGQDLGYTKNGIRYEVAGNTATVFFATIENGPRVEKETTWQRIALKRGQRGFQFECPGCGQPRPELFACLSCGPFACRTCTASLRANESRRYLEGKRKWRLSRTASVRRSRKLKS